MRIRVLRKGKTKQVHLRALESEYATRIARFHEIVVEDFAPASKGPRQGMLSAKEERLVEKLEGSVKVLLDPNGREWTSEEFARWLEDQTLRGTREVAFLVGGPDGFSDAWRGRADFLLALSRMTLTHEWAPVILLEQIYRGFCILRGLPYAR
jgi:23S rRNA (pseudouridine1915-N3)-methyltransferase